MTSKKDLMLFLRRNREERGVMAALRCLLNEELRFRGWQYIASIGGIGIIQVETVAGLYALHPMEKEDINYNFGDACRLLAAERRKKKDGDESPFDRRFRRLLSCSSKLELQAHLTYIVRCLKAEAVAVNYDTLFDDISKWGEKVRERWAIHYWSDRKERGDVSDGN